MTIQEDQARRIEALETKVAETERRLSNAEGALNTLNTRILNTLKAAEQRGFMPRAR